MRRLAHISNAVGILLCCAMAMLCARSTAAQAAGKTEQLDRVIAVVNNQVILASDLELEIHLFRLLPINDKRDSSPPKALERLTTRALIEQQILLEDPHGLEVTPEELQASLTELKQNLPDCKRRDCITPKGWADYLATIGLTPSRVETYWANRMAVLRFIEQRFRSGIRIAPEDIQKYYTETLLPQYAHPEEAPSLERISPRIQEIMLQQQVTALFNDWLKSLKEQGQVEILDASLALPADEPDASTPNAPADSAAPKPSEKPSGNGGIQ